MTLQYSVAVRNAALDSHETAIGAAPILRIRTGAPPANAGAADSGSILATIALPGDWMAAAAGGAKAKSGTWQDTAADAAGVAGHFRIYDAAGTVCHIQGTVGVSAADMLVDNTNFAAGQTFTINTFTLNSGNA